MIYLAERTMYPIKSRLSLCMRQRVNRSCQQLTCHNVYINKLIILIAPTYEEL